MDGVSGLTRHEQRVIAITLFLLVTGWATETWRTHVAAHEAPPVARQPARP
jgi:hypothetical protein